MAIVKVVAIGRGGEEKKKGEKREEREKRQKTRKIYLYTKKDRLFARAMGSRVRNHK